MNEDLLLRSVPCSNGNSCTWGKIRKDTVKGFYERNIKKRDSYISTLDDIGLWIDSKNMKTQIIMQSSGMELPLLLLYKRQPGAGRYILCFISPLKYHYPLFYFIYI